MQPLNQFGGAIGCILLLLRKSAAYYAFIASLLGVAVIATRTLRMATSTIDLAPGEIAGYILMPLSVAVFLVWYSKHAEKKSWICWNPRFNQCGGAQQGSTLQVRELPGHGGRLT